MKKYILMSTESTYRRSVNAHSVLEAIWICFGPHSVSGNIENNKAQIKAGNVNWEIIEE